MGAVVQTSTTLNSTECPPTVTFEKTGLPASTPFETRVIACNEQGSAGYAGCVSFNEAVGCVQPHLAVPASQPSHTNGVPPQPLPLMQVDTPSLASERITSLFIEWENPEFSNGYPILETELRVNDIVYNFSADTNSTTIHGLTPATQFSGELRWRNEQGWGPWSSQVWMTTLPTIPDAPPSPECGAASPDGSLATTTERLVVTVTAANATNGLAISDYEVELLLSASVTEYAGVLVFNDTVDDAIDGGDRRGRVFGLTTTDMQLPPGLALDSSTKFHVRSRARNTLGWSQWSSLSQECSVASPVFNPLWIILILCAVMVGLGICLFCVWKSNLGKIIAPRLRRKQQREIISDFVSSDMTAMEEQDPELVINPIFVHKMKRERERQRKAKVKKTGTGKIGGLARLGINLHSEPKVAVDPKKIDIMGVDRYLEKDKGIVDQSKQLSAYDREQQQKKLTKAGKHAANKSRLHAEQGNKEKLQQARDDARAAVRAGAEARAVAEASMGDDYDPIEASYASNRGKSVKGGYTAAL